ncbi:mevalonate kinase, partial [Staphylococcus aureus]
MNRFVELNNITEPLAGTIQTNLPPSRGLGSRAAVTVALVRASYDFLGKSLTKEELSEKANLAEQIAHDKP